MEEKLTSIQEHKEDKSSKTCSKISHFHTKQDWTKGNKFDKIDVDIEEIKEDDLEVIDHQNDNMKGTLTTTIKNNDWKYFQWDISSVDRKDTPSFRHKPFSDDKSQFDGKLGVPYDLPDRYLFEFFNSPSYAKFKRSYHKALRKSKGKSHDYDKINLIGDNKK